MKLQKNTVTPARMPARITRPFIASPFRFRSLVAEDDRQAVLARADHDDFRVGALGDLHRRLDALPLQELLGDPLRDDALEVGDALRFDPLALGLLALLLEHELHPLA